ncbi:MAG: hypothetical protein ACRD2F_13785, partial [Terriglobales bacterium]
TAVSSLARCGLAEFSCRRRAKLVASRADNWAIRLAYAEDAWVTSPTIAVTAWFPKLTTLPPRPG